MLGHPGRVLVTAVVAASLHLVPLPANAQSAQWLDREISGPPARYGHTMTYDSARGVTVVVGGIPANAPTTWEWNGSVWTQRMVTTPPVYSGAAAVYDSTRGVTVIFGGLAVGAVPIGQTWEWNGTVWTQQMVTGPSARYGHSMVYDSARGVTVLFGGTNSDTPAFGDTWELGVPCATPLSWATQPQSTITCPANAADFSAAASGGSGQFAYNWQIQTAANTWATLGSNPASVPCSGGGGAGSGFAFASQPSSSSTPINVSGCLGVQHWQIRAVVTDNAACGSATSNSATLIVCPADFNCSGAVTIQDIFDFLTAWFGEYVSADFNHDGRITVQDIFDFLAAWFAGCD